VPSQYQHDPTKYPNIKAPSVFTGEQVKKICEAILADSDGFLVAADRAAGAASAQPLKDFFANVTGWSAQRDQALLILSTSFRRYAGPYPGGAKEIIRNILKRCDDNQKDYVHW
jgi:hypothetical protein